MYGVYLCGCTDCFLSALFMDEEDAVKWAEETSKNSEGYSVRYFQTPLDIDKTDTGWEW